MHYQISRNGQMYGPYTREDLERYVSTGNVLPTDMAKSEAMTEWLPVSQILASGASAAETQAASAFPQATFNQPGMNQQGANQQGYAGVSPAFGQPAYGQPAFSQSGFGQPGFGQPAAYGAGLAMNAAYPDPPSLSWGLVLLADVFTCGLFQIFWNIYMALWLRKVRPSQTPLLCYGLVAGVALLTGGLVIPGFSHTHNVSGFGLGAIAGLRLVSLAWWILKLVARYSFRNELQAQYGPRGVEDIGLDVNPILLFFFGGLYLQSQLSRIAQLKTAARMNPMLPR